MFDVTVYTIILGEYDNLRPPAVIEEGVRYVCFSDRPRSCSPWEVQPAWTPLPSQSRNSRIPKLLPHLFFDSEFTIYHDGCFRLKKPPSMIVGELLHGGYDLAMFKHPCRISVYEEQQVCEKEHIGDGPDMTAQVARYREAGLRKGLWAGGFIARRNSSLTQDFNEKWWLEFKAGCARDQFALPMAVSLAGVNMNTIDKNILEDGTLVEFCWHAAFFHKGDNPAYEGERKNYQDKRRRLEDLCL
jgi:O-antigen biosynthesis protein